jgi:hypothetical protein
MAATDSRAPWRPIRARNSSSRASCRRYANVLVIPDARGARDPESSQKLRISFWIPGSHAKACAPE